MARPRCPVCRSKRWHRDRSSGLVVCEEGHILQGYRQEDNEADGPSTHATVRRKLRKNKKKKATKVADPNLFHGPRLRFLYFQCAQIILRKQIAAIIDTWKLPSELETIARDLWTMYISLTDLEAEPFREGEEIDVPNSPDKSATRDPLQKIYDALSESEDDTLPPSRRKMERPGADDDEEDDDVITDQLPEDDEDEDAGDDPASRPKLAKRTRSKKTESFNPARKLRLQYTLVICYLSCLTLRIPIQMKDVLDMAQSYKIHYLEVIQTIPEDMRRHLDMRQVELDFVPLHVMPLIEPGTGNQPQHSFAPLVNIFAKMLETNFGVKFPDINAAPILFKTVKHLGLPPFLYLVTRRVLIKLHSSLALSLRSNRAREFPDLTLAAALVFSMKLLWGLDGAPRIPQDANDMSSALPRLHEWLDFSEKLQKELPVTNVITAARTQDVASLDKDDIDDFLDLFEKTLLSDISKDQTVLGTLPLSQGGSKMTDRFFPLTSSSDNVATSSSLDHIETKRNEAIRAFYTTVSMPIPGEASSSEPLFPGQQYKIFKAADHEGTLPREYARVLQLVSDVTGIHSSVIESEVSKVEFKIAKLEAGGKQLHLPGNQLPLQGREAQMFGKIRQKAGGTPWPKDVLPEARTARPEKENALLVPRFHA